MPSTDSHQAQLLPELIAESLINLPGYIEIGVEETRYVRDLKFVVYAYQVPKLRYCALPYCAR